MIPSIDVFTLGERLILAGSIDSVPGQKLTHDGTKMI